MRPIIGLTFSRFSTKRVDRLDIHDTDKIELEELNTRQMRIGHWIKLQITHYKLQINPLLPLIDPLPPPLALIFCW